MPPSRPWKKKLLVAGAALAAALVAGELVVRVAVGAPLSERLPISEIRADAACGWRMVANQDHYTYEHPVHVNSLGLRGPELAPKGPDRPRVLALGDSLTYGQGVGDDETLPAYLQAALRRDDPEKRAWEVVNAGHRAYDTNQELALLDEIGDAVQPDVILVFWYWNDLRERDVAASNARLLRTGPVAFDTNARMEGWTLWRWRLRQLARRSALVMYAWDVIGPRKPGDEIGGELAEHGFARLQQHLAHLVSSARRLGATPIFCTVPDRRSLLGEHPSAALAARARELAEASGLTTVDLAPPLRELAQRLGKPPVLPYDGHYRPDGNRAMAEALAQRQLERGTWCPSK